MSEKSDSRFTRRKFLAATAPVAAAPIILTRTAKAAVEVGQANARVTVDPEPLHDLPLTQYSHFIEHLGMCIKGGIWAEGEKDDMFLGGVRQELIEAVRSIHPALLRYPGGCFADGYHWQDGIGPRSGRPKRRNLAWDKLGPLVGPREDNHFGTDEFLQFCEAVDTEPMITVNVGSGTAEEAAQWVEYTNGSKDTKWGSERAKNGHPEPYGVKYWFVGNEIFGWHEIGHQTPPEYVGTLKAYSQAMRAVDPDIKLIAVGSHMPLNGSESPNKTVLQGAGDLIDYLSIHRYVPEATSANTLRFMFADLQRSDSRNIFYDVMGTLLKMDECLKVNAWEARTYSPAGKKVPVAFDEWNLWFNFARDIYRANYCLRDGVWTASMLNMLHRYAPDVPIANIAQMVNCLGIITSTKKGTFLTPSALAFKLYTERAGAKLLPSMVDCPEIPHESGLPILDVSATRSKGKVSLFLVNRHHDAEVSLTCLLKGLKVKPGARRSEVFHKDPVKYNTFKNPESVKIVETPEALAVEDHGEGSCFTCRVKPHSFACLELETDKA